MSLTKFLLEKHEAEEAIKSFLAELDGLSDEQEQVKEKVSRDGLDSLSDEEQDVLDELKAEYWPEPCKMCGSNSDHEAGIIIRNGGYCASCVRGTEY